MKARTKILLDAMPLVAVNGADYIRREDEACPGCCASIACCAGRWASPASRLFKSLFSEGEGADGYYWPTSRWTNLPRRAVAKAYTARIIALQLAALISEEVR